MSTLASLLEVADTRQADTSVIDRAMASPTPFVRAYAARVTGQVGIEARAGMLRSLVADRDSMVAADAAFALGMLRDSVALPALVSALAGPPTVVAAAAWSLGEIGESARTSIERVLRAGQPAASLSDVLQASAKLRPVPASLITPYLTHSDTGVRRAAAYAVTRSRVPAAAGALVALANRLPTGDAGTGRGQADVDLRSYVARGLAKPAVPDSLASDALAALRRLLNDANPPVRINAIRALATYQADARAELVRHISDPDANARIALAQSLGGVLNTASDWEEAWQADTGLTYRRAVLSAAARSGVRLLATDPSRADSWQHRADWRFRAAAAEAAVSVRDVDAIGVPLLRDPDPRVRNAAYSAAVAMADSDTSTGKPYARRALSSALGDSDLFVRATILDALRARARTAEARVALDAWRRAVLDPENDARLAALRVIVTAWRSDSSSFGALRDTIASITPPSDPLEREIGRLIGPWQHWPRTGVTPRPRSWYVEQAQATARAQAGRGTSASIMTVRGTIRIALFGADAPLTVNNFVRLARRGYYNGLAFHRVVPNFVVQDGDPRGDGSGGPGYAIRDELNRRWYDRGAVGMALSGPDTGGSQYFITHSPQPHLDGHYPVFGHVVAGFDVLGAIVQGDRILSVTVQ